MSEGVEAVQHQVEHHLEHGEAHGEEKGLTSRNKRIALLIAVFALCLAFSETLGKSAQTEGLSYNVEASNLWAFFQAKTIRRTLVETAALAVALQANVAPGDIKDAIAKQVDAWQKAAARYRSEPETHEGTQELMERAKEAERERDTALARYHQYEIASAAFQIAIVLASATVITGMIVLAWLAGALAVVGLGFMALGLLAPHAVHLF